MKKLLIILVIAMACILQTNAQEEQNFTLTGTVLDSRSEPVVGATVYVKDKPGVGTTTNLQGKFTLKLNTYDMLIVSYIGYDQYEQRITKKTTSLNITLTENAKQVDEVVVVGMGTQRKISIVGAISTVSPSQLDAPATNIVNSLAGRVPGIIATQTSGEPGKNISEFWVRGIGTFGASSGALVLIDGLEGTLSQIDAADVESFSVLKDASATAVYGSRGANGVVIVTTKRGLDQKLKITARTNFSVSQLKRLPKYLGSYEYAQLANEAADASGMPKIYDDITMDIIKYGLEPDLYPNVDWQKEILNPTSFQNTYYVSAQGGGSVARYFASLGMSNETSAYKAAKDSKYSKGVGYDTYNYRLNLDFNVTKTTQAYIGATGYMSVNNRPSMGKNYSRNTSLTDWIWASQAKTTPLMYPLRYSSGELPSAGIDSDIPPHVLLNYTGSQKEENTTNLINVGIAQDLSMLTKGLKAKIQGSWDSRGNFGESRYKMPALYYASDRTSNGMLKLTKRVNEESIKYGNATWSWQKLYFDANVTYDRQFGDHSVGGLLFYYLESTSESGFDSSMNAIPKRYQSLSGRATYGYRNTYLLDVNFGLNGSENFKAGQQYGFFPSAAIGWVPTSYKFMQENVKWLNFLKFRFSYGVVGNDRISQTRFPYLTIINEDNGVGTWWGGTGILNEDRVGADNLMWEKAKKLDAGIDIHMFKDNFRLTVDYFSDTRDGIFQSRTQVPDYVGVVTMPYGNVGSMESTGADGNVEYFQSLGKDASITFRGNFTYSRNKVINWEEANLKYDYLGREGLPHDSQRGFIALGLFKDQNDVDMSPPQFGTVRPGDIKYKDINGDGSITDDDVVPLFSNSMLPQLTYGFGAETRWKGWTLNVLFRGTGSRKFLYGGTQADRFDGYIAFNSGYKGNVRDIVYDQSNRWTSAEYSGDPSTENPNARFPRLYYGSNSNNTKRSTFWQGDARYLRLQELSLNYNLSLGTLRRALGIQSIDIQVLCENLFVWDSVKLFDPEQALTNGHSYPIPGRYTLQLSINF